MTNILYKTSLLHLLSFEQLYILSEFGSVFDQIVNIEIIFSSLFLEHMQ